MSMRIFGWATFQPRISYSVKGFYSPRITNLTRLNSFFYLICPLRNPSLVYFGRSRPAQAHKTRLETQTHSYQTWSPAYERVRPPKISSTLKFFPKCRLLLTDGSLNHKLMVVFLIFTNHLHYILTRLPIKEIWLKLNTYQFPDLLSLVVNHTWYCPN